MTAWIAGLSFVSANLGSLEMMGWAGSAYQYGILATHWYWIGAIPAMLFLGIVPVLATYLPVMIIASWIGNWLFYVQHQFDGAYWEEERDWSFHAASIRGRSYFKLPPILQWFSGSIGLHHVHHLCSRVPNYRLQACLDTAPELDRFVTRITLWQSLRCWRLALWDEQRRLLVGFRDLKLGAA